MKLKLFPGAQEDNDSVKYRFDRIKSHLYRTSTPGAPFFRMISSRTSNCKTFSFRKFFQKLTLSNDKK